MLQNTDVVRAVHLSTGAQLSHLLNVLHDTADDNIAILVSQCINIKLNSTVQVLVNQHRLVRVHLYCCCNVPVEHKAVAQCPGYQVVPGI